MKNTFVITCLSFIYCAVVGKEFEPFSRYDHDLVTHNNRFSAHLSTFNGYNHTVNVLTVKLAYNTTSEEGILVMR